LTFDKKLLFINILFSVNYIKLIPFNTASDKAFGGCQNEMSTQPNTSYKNELDSLLFLNFQSFYKAQFITA